MPINSTRPALRSIGSSFLLSTGFAPFGMNSDFPFHQTTVCARSRRHMSLRLETAVWQEEEEPIFFDAFRFRADAQPMLSDKELSQHA
jgi:hypothetical protein